jgi:hypothetical protein
MMALRGDRGSSLFLYPVGVLIVIVLGAIAADFSHVYMARRDLVELTGTIANDVSTAGIDEQTFRTDELYTLDPERTEGIVDEILASANSRTVPAQLAPAGMTVTNPTLVDHLDRPIRRCQPAPGQPCRVAVTLVARVEYILGRALPGDRGVDLRVTSYATLEEG